MSENFFSDLVSTLNPDKKCRVAVPLANDDACAYAICHAVKTGILQATLIGDPEQIKVMYGDIAQHDQVKIIDERDEKKACSMAVKEVREGRCDILMKGMVATSTLLKAVLNSSEGLRKNPILSHLTFFEFPEKPGLKILTDAAMCIAPDAEDLMKEIDNAVEAYAMFADHTPKVALLAANEKISEKVPSTVLGDRVAKALAEKKNMIVEGPISFDLAVSKESAQIKKYNGKIQGDADIFVVPRIDTGNAFYKALQYYVKAPMGGLVYGARCPVVLTSRADDNNTKFYSLLLGMVIWQRSTVSESVNQSRN
ncbi:MAG: phosphate butyryltransferase [Candidatus Riflebacteria bacterium HGW-Riflebacteria-2]|nr:MAG: phosphate butyryltransferase [Candidatus Riflebacteria bacterium HGW-Riflebacteria-2]